MGEVAGLPATGPTDLATVKAELGYTTTDAARDARLQLRVDAANSYARSLPVASDALTYGTPPPAWPAYVRAGTTMLATRLWRRKDSPSGVEVLGGDQVAYVSRTDPDVAQLLKVGTYSPPQVG